MTFYFSYFNSFELMFQDEIYKIKIFITHTKEKDKENLSGNTFSIKGL